MVNDQVMAYTIFFATSTGKTEDVADKLKELLPGTEAKDVDNIGSAADLASAEALICCVPTWNTGADEGRSGTAWDTYAEEIPSMDFSAIPSTINENHPKNLKALQQVFI